jgi:hypothetical protein
MRCEVPFSTAPMSRLVLRCGRLAARAPAAAGPRCGASAAVPDVLELLHKGVDWELENGSRNYKGKDKQFSDFLVSAGAHKMAGLCRPPPAAAPVRST